MSNNLSLDSKTIYQIELIAIYILAGLVIVLTVIHGYQLFKPAPVPINTDVRVQQLQNAVKLIAPADSP